MLTKADIEKYFTAEKNEAVLFLILGLIAILGSVVLFFYFKKDVFKGASIPFLLIGLLHFTVGYTIFKKSDNDRINNVYAYTMNPYQFKEKELPRMITVNKNFVYYRYTEIALALIGIGLFFYFKNNLQQMFWKGFAIALAIEALVSLSADYFAEKRGGVYQKQIEEFVNNQKM